MKFAHFLCLIALSIPFQTKGWSAEKEDQFKIKSPLSLELFSDHSQFKPHHSFYVDDITSLKSRSTFTGIGLNYQLKSDMALIARIGYLSMAIHFKESGVAETEKTPQIPTYQLGLKYRLFSRSDLSVFLEPSILIARRVEQSPEQLRIDRNLERKITDRCISNLYNFTTRLIAEKRLGDLTPYLGLQYQDLFLKSKEHSTATDRDVSSGQILETQQTCETNRAQINERKVGLICGLRHRLTDRAALKVEGRFLNERAFCASLNFAF